MKRSALTLFLISCIVAFSACANGTFSVAPGATLQGAYTAPPTPVLAGGKARGAAQGNLPDAAKTAPGATIEGGLPGEHGNLPALVIRAGSLRFLASLYDNDTTRAFLEVLPLTIEMEELNGNEKYYYFEKGFPTAGERVGGIHSGDLMLYGADCLVLFYESFPTSYSYTRLGYIQDVEGLANALGSEQVKVTFEIGE